MPNYVTVRDPHLRTEELLKEELKLHELKLNTILYVCMFLLTCICLFHLSSNLTLVPVSLSIICYVLMHFPGRPFT